MLDVLVFVKRQKLVQCIVWIESIFSSQCVKQLGPQFISAKAQNIIIRY